MDCKVLFFSYSLSKGDKCSAVLAHFILKEKLHIFGVLGCILCVVGSTSIVLHAPKERDIESVKQVWRLATQPGTYKWPFAIFAFLDRGLEKLARMLVWLGTYLCPFSNFGQHSISSIFYHYSHWANIMVSHTRFHYLYCCGRYSCYYSDSPLCATLRTHSYDGVRRDLLSYGFSNG